MDGKSLPTASAPDGPPPAGRRSTPAANVVVARQAATTVLLDLDGGRYYSLNESGGHIWEMLESGADEEEIAERLGALYDAPPDRIASDIATLIERLRWRGLVS